MSAAERAASMSPDELIAVIERGLDADEQAARACSGDGRWTAEDIASIGPNLGVEPREHMARHDPSRVLAVVAAKREIVARCKATLDYAEGMSEVDHYGALGLAEEMLCFLARPYLIQETPPSAD